MDNRSVSFTALHLGGFARNEFNENSRTIDNESFAMTSINCKRTPANYIWRESRADPEKTMKEEYFAQRRYAAKAPGIMISEQGGFVDTLDRAMRFTGYFPTMTNLTGQERRIKQGVRLNPRAHPRQRMSIN
ncbi:MAG: hypothetical protein NUW37_01765 [Planctomycetes bacterium]|nr:hypothetical protein [Planctomycetota bacterium]